jgi:hypothetical protein
MSASNNARAGRVIASNTVVVVDVVVIVVVIVVVVVVVVVVLLFVVCCCRTSVYLLVVYLLACLLLKLLLCMLLLVADWWLFDAATINKQHVQTYDSNGTQLKIIKNLASKLRFRPYTKLYDFAKTVSSRTSIKALVPSTPKQAIAAPVLCSNCSPSARKNCGSQGTNRFTWPGYPKIPKAFQHNPKHHRI